MFWKLKSRIYCYGTTRLGKHGSQMTGPRTCLHAEYQKTGPGTSQQAEYENRHIATDQTEPLTSILM